MLLPPEKWPPLNTVGAGERSWPGLVCTFLVCLQSENRGRVGIWRGALRFAW